jgi:hypothetical protein
MAKRKTAKNQPPADQENAREIQALKARILALEGKTLSKQQTADLWWLTKRDSDSHIRSFLESCPKGIYCELAGRQHKLIDDAAENHNLPIFGPAVNLFHAVKALHDRVIEYSSGRNPALDGDLDELKQEKLKREIVKLTHQATQLEIDIQRRRDSLVDRNEVRERLLWLSHFLAKLGKRLAKSGGPEAQRVFNEHLRTLAEEIESGALRT